MHRAEELIAPDCIALAGFVAVRGRDYVAVLSFGGFGGEYDGREHVVPSLGRYRYTGLFLCAPVD